MSAVRDSGLSGCSSASAFSCESAFMGVSWLSALALLESGGCVIEMARVRLTISVQLLVAVVLATVLSF